MPEPDAQTGAGNPTWPALHAALNLMFRGLLVTLARFRDAVCAAADQGYGG
jgi:hypothetical protein